MQNRDGFHQPARKRLRSQNVVHHNLQGQGIEESQRQGEDAQAGDSDEVRPAAPGLQEHTRENGFIHL
jgi:hypothetical protein